MAKKEINTAYDIGIDGYSYYQECLANARRLMNLYGGTPTAVTPDLASAVCRLARCEGRALDNCGMQGIVSQQAIKKALEARGEEVSKAPTDDQLKKAGSLVKADKIDFKTLEYSPYGEPPKVPPLYDEKFNEIKDGPKYEEYLKNCQDAYDLQCGMLAGKIQKEGAAFIATLPPKVIAAQKDLIEASLDAKHEQESAKQQAKIDKYNGKDEVIIKPDGTMENVHTPGLIEQKKEEYGRLSEEYKTLSQALKNPGNTPEQIARIRQAMKENLAARKAANESLRSYNKELEQERTAQRELWASQDKEGKQLDKELDRRAIRKAEKQLSGETKERISIRQKLADARMRLESKVEDVRVQNDGQIVRPILKAAGEHLVSGISTKFKQFVGAVRAKVDDIKVKFAEGEVAYASEYEDVPSWIPRDLENSEEAATGKTPDEATEETSETPTEETVEETTATTVEGLTAEEISQKEAEAAADATKVTEAAATGEVAEEQ